MLFLIAGLIHFAEARVQHDVLQQPGGRLPARWTLLDWLEEQNQISLVRSLLPWNRTSRFFEAGLTVRGGRSWLRPGGTEESRRVDFDPFASILTAHFGYDVSSKTSSAKELGLGLRVLGISTETTNVVVRYGWREQTDPALFAPAGERRFTEVAAQLYLANPVGIEGAHRWYEKRGVREGLSLFVERQPVRVSFGVERESLGAVRRDSALASLKAFF